MRELVSTGMNTLDEIKATCEFPDDVASEYALFYCVSAYPTTAADFYFKTIETLEEMVDVPVGFSDHSIGVEAAKVAIGNGAALIEKHFTINRRLPGPNRAVSIEPDDLADPPKFAMLYHETFTEKEELADEEVDIKQWAHHSIVATEPIDQGEELTKKNTTMKRPETGLSAE